MSLITLCTVKLPVRGQGGAAHGAMQGMPGEKGPVPHVQGHRRGLRMVRPSQVQQVRRRWRLFRMQRLGLQLRVVAVGRPRSFMTARRRSRRAVIVPWARAERSECRWNDRDRLSGFVTSRIQRSSGLGLGTRTTAPGLSQARRALAVAPYVASGDLVPIVHRPERPQHLLDRDLGWQ